MSLYLRDYFFHTGTFLSINAFKKTIFKQLISGVFCIVLPNPFLEYFFKNLENKFSPKL